MSDNHIPLRFATDLTVLRDVVDGREVIIPAGQTIDAATLQNVPKPLLSTIVVVRPQINLNQIIKENIARYEQQATQRVTKLGQKVAAGTTLFSEGEASRDAFLLLDGEVEIISGGRVVSLIDKEGAFIGEMAAIRSKARSATAVAKTDCMLHTFDGSSLLSQAKSQPLVMVRLCRNLAKKLHEINQKISLEVVSTVSERDVTRAIDEMDDPQSDMTKTFPAGTTLFHQGDTSLDLYVLLDGALSVEVDERQVTSLRERGSIIGEMSSLLGQPRSATVRTETQATLASICITKLEQFTSFMPSLLEKIAVSLAERIAATTDDYIRLSR